MTDKIARELSILEELVTDPAEIESSGETHKKRTLDDLVFEGRR